MESNKHKETCNLHGDYTAESITIYGRTFKTCCPICAAIAEAEEQKQEKAKNYERMNIEPCYQGLTLADYLPKNETQQRAKNAVEKLINGELKKVILLGSNGLGKTMLGSIAAAELEGCIYTAYEISLIVNGAADKYSQLDRLARLPILVIDEYEKSRNSEAKENIFSYILDKRHVRGLRTMIMSETHLFRSCKNGGCNDCFESILKNDIVSRFKQDAEIIEITGQDQRGLKC